MNAYPKHLVDSHFHLLSMKRKGFDLPSVLASMQQAEIEGIDVGLDATDLPVRSAVCAPYPFIHLASGIGPWGADEKEGPIEDQMKVLTEHLKGYDVVAIGEIGLDNHHKYGSIERQQQLVDVQLDLAHQLNKPVIFHNREADSQFISLFTSRSFGKCGILHCFQGSEALARLAVEKGFFISFAGPLTYKANSEMQRIFNLVPLEQILLETDSPYLSPVPVRGRPNSPLNMEHIYRFAAELRQMELNQFIAQIQSNFHRFLKQ